MTKLKSNYSMQTFRRVLESKVSLAALGWATFAAFVSTSVSVTPAEAADDEIIVTITRRDATSIQDIPLAVTAFDAEELQQRGIDTLTDITRSVPGVVITDQGAGRNEIVIRGMSTTGVLDPTDTARNALVSVYLDDVPISIQGATPDIRVYDLERVEFLRGPQGTLFGAGAMAGLVRYVTKKPDLEEFGASIQFGAATTKGGEESYSIRGMANIPLSENLGLRITAYRGVDGGYIDNVTTGEDDFNDVEITQVRSAVRFTNQNNFTADVSHLYGLIEAGATNRTYSDLPEYSFAAFNSEANDDEFHIFNLATETNFSIGDLITSTSYLDREFTSTSDNEFFGLAFFGLGADNFSLIENTFESFTQEVRFNSDIDGPFSFQIGAFFEKTNRNYFQRNNWAGLDALTMTDAVTFWGAPEPDDVFASISDTDSRQFAFFGEATYSPSEYFDLTVGLRQFSWKQTYDLASFGLAGSLAPGVPAEFENRTSRESGVNPRVSVTYHPNDSTILYAEAAKGFRFGGTNQFVPVLFCGADLAAIGLSEAPIDFGADSVWTYTVGEKGTFANGSLVFNVAGYVTNWNDVQNNNSLGCGYYFTENTGELQIKGVELESQFYATDNLSFSLAASYTDSEATVDIPNLNALDGDRAPFFPEWLLSVGGEYVHPFAGGELIFQADYTYRGDAGTRFSETDPVYTRIPESNLFNAALTWRYENYKVSIFGRNLTNEYTVTGIAFNRLAPFQPGNHENVGRPRTFGIRVGADF